MKEAKEATGLRRAEKESNGQERVENLFLPKKTDKEFKWY
jgi:hypothetical protein